jgi:transposase
MFLAQVLSADGSCRQAVDDAAVKRLVGGLEPRSANTSPYVLNSLRFNGSVTSPSATPSGVVSADAGRHPGIPGEIVVDGPGDVAPLSDSPDHEGLAYVGVASGEDPTVNRRGIDGLAALCRQRLGEDPMAGAIFVFPNRRGTSLKLLCYDGQGFWLCQKRLSQGRLTWWPSAAQVSHRLSARELQILLWNGNPEDAGMAEDWRRVA